MPCDAFVRQWRRSAVARSLSVPVRPRRLGRCRFRRFEERVRWEVFGVLRGDAPCCRHRPGGRWPTARVLDMPGDERGPAGRRLRHRLGTSGTAATPAGTCRPVRSPGKVLPMTAQQRVDEDARRRRPAVLLSRSPGRPAAERWRTAAPPGHRYRLPGIDFGGGPGIVRQAPVCRCGCDAGRRWGRPGSGCSSGSVAAGSPPPTHDTCSTTDPVPRYATGSGRESVTTGPLP